MRMGWVRTIRATPVSAVPARREGACLEAVGLPESAFLAALAVVRAWAADRLRSPAAAEPAGPAAGVPQVWAAPALAADHAAACRQAPAAVHLLRVLVFRAAISPAASVASRVRTSP